MVARGYASISFLHSAAEAIQAKGKPAYIYHLGDLDPSGQDAARDIEAKLRRYAPEAEIHFERIAVTRSQVEEWNLPTRPTKQKDPRAKKFAGTSVELDAIPATKLRSLVKACIEKHIDPDQLKVLRVAEESERETLAKWARIVGGNLRHDPAEEATSAPPKSPSGRPQTRAAAGRRVSVRLRSAAVLEAVLEVERASLSTRCCADTPRCRSRPIGSWAPTYCRSTKGLKPRFANWHRGGGER